MDLVVLSDRTPAALDLEALRGEAAGFARASKARGTVRVYEREWNAFLAWCLEAGLQDLPATPETVALYVAHLARTKAVSTINLAVSAISQIHQAAGLETPTQTAEFRATFRGIRRTKGVAVTKKKAATADVVDAMLKELPASLLGVRDKAIILMAYALGVRRAELVGLDVEDLEFSAAGVAVTIRRSKRDQEGEGRRVGMAKSAHPRTCPVRALEAWLVGSGIESGPVFRAVNRHGHVAEGRMDAGSIARIVQRAIERLGPDYDKAEWAAHSTRSGHITERAARGDSEAAIARHTGHQSMKVLRGYVRHATVFVDAQAASLGL